MSRDTETIWRDNKRYLWLFALVMPLIPFAAIGLFTASGWSVWLWLGPIVILGIVPLIDWTVGRDPSSAPDAAIDALERDRYYRWLTFLFLPLQYAGFVYALWFIASGRLSVIESIGLAVTIGFIGGLGINTAHELGHKREAHERWLSKIALAQTAYGHFYIEHNRGHHVRVATPDDPASSRLGESFYRFWPRTVAGSLRSAWELEQRRFARRNQRPWRFDNDVVNSLAMTVVLWLVMLVWLGPGIAPYLVIQALIGITLLEAVNYLEHYGLLRQRVSHNGRERYERVEPRHSWNSNNVATNVLLYHLQRHSDHHAHPTRRYQALQDDQQAPVLPTGYAGMILLALVPFLWRKVMDPLVAQHYGGDLSLANLTPRRRAAMNTVPLITLVDDDESVAKETEQRVNAARCPGCGYTYDTRIGAEREGFPPGTSWEAIPNSWCCPDCGVRDKLDFVPIEVADA